ENGTCLIALCQQETVACCSVIKNLEFYHENKSWIDALEQCQTDYTSLVEITNKTVNDEVKSLLQNATHLQRGVWIGLERSVFGKDKEWMWISNFALKCAHFIQPSIKVQIHSLLDGGTFIYVHTELFCLRKTSKKKNKKTKLNVFKGEKFK
uniref:C-type lectin domain-containing protein n=1 Tax=Neolamprologus brichardi TaxID=32507 RepID=A0A3Q4GS27_NEOBR